jgi:hypothetical protein
VYQNYNSIGGWFEEFYDSKFAGRRACRVAVAGEGQWPNHRGGDTGDFDGGGEAGGAGFYWA